MPKAKTPRTTTNGKAKATTATPEVQLASTPAVAAPAATEVVKEVAKIEAVKNETAKQEAVKPEAKPTKRPEARKNVFPINLDEEIRRRAYELSEQRGFTPGHENEDWLIAEREILALYTERQSA